MRPYEEIRVEVPGFTIAAKSWGKKSGMPVLCLHGKLDNAASFDYLVPLLGDVYAVAIDFPGTGNSSHYPRGVMPSWKNDALLMLHLARAMGWERFDIIAHSLGSLMGTMMTVSGQKMVRKLIFLDTLGPRTDFIHRSIEYLHRDVSTFLENEQGAPTIFPNAEAAIVDRMKIGPITHQAASALVARGTRQVENGVAWNFDRRLRCVSATLPHQDELTSMFRAIDIPVCLITAEDGLRYREDVFLARSQAIPNLSIKNVPGGHHAHMDFPKAVAEIVNGFLFE